jgi:hypothetical protein
MEGVSVKKTSTERSSHRSVWQQGLAAKGFGGQPLALFSLYIS